MDKNTWKTLLYIALTVFAGVLIEVSLIYFGKVRGGNLPFSVSVKPNYDF